MISKHEKYYSYNYIIIPECHLKVLCSNETIDSGVNEEIKSNIYDNNQCTCTIERKLGYKWHCHVYINF